MVEQGSASCPLCMARKVSMSHAHKRQPRRALARRGASAGMALVDCAACLAGSRVGTTVGRHAAAALLGRTCDAQGSRDTAQGVVPGTAMGWLGAGQRVGNPCLPEANHHAQAACMHARPGRQRSHEIERRLRARHVEVAGHYRDVPAGLGRTAGRGFRAHSRRTVWGQ